VRQDHPINWYENRDAYIAGLMNFIAISVVETCGAIPDRYITELSKIRAPQPNPIASGRVF
jgi:hypothetical protein